MRLQNKTAVITGACSGIGKAIAEMFLKEGANVVFSDINPCAAMENYGAKAIYIKTDVTESAAVDNLVKTAVEKFGSLDIMVNNAGISGMTELAAMANSEWDKVLAVNLNGVFYGVRAAGRYMKDNHIKGSIINMASILGQVGFPNAGAYCAAKGGVNQLTRTAALELASNAIRVNSIAPAFIKTPLTKGCQDNEGLNALITGATPLGCFGEPDDIAYAAVYLASDEAKFVTGSVLYVDGGWTAR